MHTLTRKGQSQRTSLILQATRPDNHGFIFSRGALREKRRKKSGFRRECKGKHRLSKRRFSEETNSGRESANLKYPVAARKKEGTRPRGRGETHPCSQARAARAKGMLSEMPRSVAVSFVCRRVADTPQDQAVSRIPSCFSCPGIGSGPALSSPAGCGMPRSAFLLLINLRSLLWARSGPASAGTSAPEAQMKFTYPVKRRRERLKIQNDSRRLPGLSSTPCRADARTGACQRKPMSLSSRISRSRGLPLVVR